jgi:CRP-like cAMP-binding protein
MVISREDFSSCFPDIAGNTDEGELDALLNALALRRLPAGENLLNDGDLTSSLYLVWTGTLVAYLEDEHVSVELGKINPGQSVGEISLFQPGPATATVKALTDCSLLMLPKEIFTALAREHPALTSKLLRMHAKMIIDRLNAADELLLGTEAMQARAGGMKALFARIYYKLLGYEEDAA